MTDVADSDDNGQVVTEMYCDVLVIGAGFAGTIIGNMFSQQGKDVSVIDIGKGDNNHFAIMRFRDPQVGRPLGVNLRDVLVEKAVYWNHQIHYHADIRMKNSYSLKTYGSLGYRSLGELGVVKRYLIDGKFSRYRHTMWDCSPTEFGETNGMHWCSFDANQSYRNTDPSIVERVCCYYKYCVSTIPLPKLAELLPDISFPGKEFRATPIYVTRIKLNDNVHSKVNQTIYFPEDSFSAYRVSLEENTLIIESVEPEVHTVTPSDADELTEILGAFGLSKCQIGQHLMAGPFTQRLGKLSDVDDNVRRKVIYNITDKHSIFSLGRFAIWKPIRADQLIEDAEKVLRMINMGMDRFAYVRRLRGGE